MIQRDAGREQDKIKTIEELAEILVSLRASNRKVVHCHGVFDLLHIGHIRHFEAARGEGDILVVTLTRDEHVGKGPGHPVFNQDLRAESIAALQCVDYVAINEWPTATETIKKLKPDVYVKGSDYIKREDDLSEKIYEEEEAVKSVGGRIHFTNELAISSTELLNANFGVYPETAREFLQKFRRKYSAKDVIQQFNDIRKMKVLVIGDTIIDEYHYCKTMGMSPKGNTITTKYLEEEVFAGGVLAAANHVAGFCDDVHLVTCLGTQNTHEDFILTHLKPNIKPKLFYREDAPTVVKRRFVEPAFLSKMFEVCYLNDHELPEPLYQDVCRYLRATIPDYDLVMVADFGHGFIGQNIVEVLCAESRFLAVSTQANSANAGFNLITKYPRADYVCIDEPEARLACRDKFGKTEDLAINIAKKLQCDRIAITHGNYDTLIYAPEDGFFKIPVFSNKVVDTVGAGDAFLSITSPCVAANCPMEMVGFIGNAVGALGVQIVCNRTSVEPIPVFKFIDALLK